MKGYKTSKDYAPLWELINKGYRVICEIQTSLSPQLVYVSYDLIGFAIGAHTYAQRKDEVNSFIDKCKELDLEFIPPTTTETEQQ